MTVLQAVLLCFLLAALIRAPAESGPYPYRWVGYLIVIIVLTYLLVAGVVR